MEEIDQIILNQLNHIGCDLDGNLKHLNEIDDLVNAFIMSAQLTLRSVREVASELAKMVWLSAPVIIVTLLTLTQFTVGSSTVGSSTVRDSNRTDQEASISKQTGASGDHNNGGADHFEFGLNDDQSPDDKPSEETHTEPSDPKGDASADDASELKFDREDIANRLFDLFNEDSESKTELLDEQSLNLANGFEKFNEEVVKIYREELANLRLHPNDVYRDKNTKLSALEQNSDEIFYKWFAFSLTTKKIVNSLTYSLSSKFIEHSELNLSPKCMLSMLISLEELKQQKLWVVKMLDTTGKPEFHNILDGSIISLGGYDQCLAIESPKLLRSKPGTIHGKYCLVKYDIPLPARPKHIDIRTRLFNYTNTEMEGTAIEDFSSFAHALYEQKPRVGFCIPSLCDEKDLQLMLDIYFHNSTMSANVDYCYSKVDHPKSDGLLQKLGVPIEEMSNLQIYILTAYIVIAVFVVIGTAIDLWADAQEQREILEINKLSEHNLKAISNWNQSYHLRSFSHTQSLGRYMVRMPSQIQTPSTAGSLNYTEESPFFRESKLTDRRGASIEMKSLDAETRRRMFRSTQPSLTSVVPPTPQPEEQTKLTVSENYLLFGRWPISKKNKLLRTFTAFSVYTNGRKLFRATTSSDELDSLHGIRVISMLWIVLTHTYLLPIKSTMFYSRKFLHVSESSAFQFIVNGWVLVDSFFFVGSLLVTFNQLRILTRTKGRINLFRIILQRLIRISPSLWFLISLIFILPAFVKGPLVHDYLDNQIQYCRDGWWLNVLFANNWFPLEKITLTNQSSPQCFLHTWYLSADFQMYVASLPIIMILYKWPKFGCLLSLVGILASGAGTFYYTWIGDRPPTVIFNSPIEIEALRSAAEVYTITLPHIAPYMLGILAGYILFKSREHKINSYIVCIGWLSMISLALTILMWTQKWNQGQPWTTLSSSLYASLHRIGWALVLFWITFACSTNHGGFINSFLSWRFFKYLSKLSYSVYLIHFLVIWGRLSYGRNTLGFSHYTMACEFIVNVVFSLAASVVLYLCIELPAINLYNVHLLGSFEVLTVKLEKRNASTADAPKDRNSYWF